MKKGIHPDYHNKAKIACACGAVYEIGSTVAEISGDLCGACHPVYTGKEKKNDKGPPL